MEKTQDTLDYDGKAPGDLPRTAAKETRERASAYANASMHVIRANVTMIGMAAFQKAHQALEPRPLQGNFPCFHWGQCLL